MRIFSSSSFFSGRLDMIMMKRHLRRSLGVYMHPLVHLHLIVFFQTPNLSFDGLVERVFLLGLLVMLNTVIRM